MKMWTDTPTPTRRDHPMVTIGVDLASGKDHSVYRCQCGHCTDSAREMLIHQYQHHGGQRWM